METCLVLPLWELNADLVIRNLVAPDSEVGCYYQCYDNPTLYISACHILSMFHLHCEAYGYVFKRILHLYDKEAVHRDKEGGGGVLAVP